MSDAEQKKMKTIALLGASFTTGNLGVSALAWSAIKVIWAKWPDANIVLLGGQTPGVEKIRINSLERKVMVWPVRYCINILTQNHILKLGIAVSVSRFLPFFKRSIMQNKFTLGALLKCDLICDITGGDSFSDIYGLSRFFRGYLLKRICQMTGAQFLMLPQTYGPFNSYIARKLAKRVLDRTEVTYSRDQEGVEAVKKILGKGAPVMMCPDVAFVLDSVSPNNDVLRLIENIRLKGQLLIGLNISGLLYNGGYTRSNMFGLACDYPKLIVEIIKYFLEKPNCRLLLVPHVLPKGGYEIEDDYLAGIEALKSISDELRDRVTVLDKGYDQNETKYIIGLCDFFLGARMHATIAALSQSVPAVGMAYSKKFVGVFETAGVADCVTDLRQFNNDKILRDIDKLFNNRGKIEAILNNNVGCMQNKILDIFENI